MMTTIKANPTRAAEAAFPVMPEPTLAPVVRSAGEGERLTVIDHHARVMLTAAETGGALSVFDYASPRGSGVPPHTHSVEDEIWLVLEGALDITVAGVTHRVGPGGIAFGPRGIEHAFRCVGEGTNRFILITTPGGFERFFSEVDRDTPAGGVIPVPRLLELVARHGMRM